MSAAAPAAARPRLLLSSQAGSPADPRVWSGTPFKILQALEAEGRLLPLAHSSLPSERARRWLARADGLLGLRHPFIPGPLRRSHAAREVQAQARAQDCQATLHLGTYDLSLRSGALPSFLYVDNSYDFWEQHAAAASALSAHQRQWFRRLEALALRRVRHIFTAGEHIAENFVSRFGIAPGRVTAVGTGMGDIQPFRAAKDYGQERLLIVAKARPGDKGLPLLLAALDIARRTRPRLSLTVIGGAKYPELRERPGVTGTGWISAEELQGIFQAASLYVMPAGYEPWGLSYLEALACRIPVVGLKRGAVPEITADGRYGFLLDEASPEALARLILDALADPQRLERMGREGQEYCLQRYRWSSLAERIATVIERSL